MRASEGRLKLHIRDGESRRKAGVLYRGAIGALLAAALLWVLFGGLDLAGAGLPVWAAVLGGAIGLVLTQVSGLGTPSEEGTARRGGLAAAIAILAVMLLALVLRGQFSGGLNAFLQQISLRLTEAHGRIYPNFGTGEEGGSYPLFSLVLGLLTGLFAGLSCSRAPLILVPAGLVFAGAVSGVVPAGPALAVFGAAAAIFLIARSAGNGSQENKYRAAALVAAGAVLLTLLAGGAGYGTGLYRAGNASGLADRAGALIHRMRYEDHGSVLPEGRLDETKALEPTGRVTLKVTMAEPEGMYLRGFVGEQLEDGRWTGLTGSALSEARDAFYWIHDSGIYGQSLPAAALALTGETSVNSVTIEEENACRHYLYTPYSLLQSDAVLADSAAIGDGAILNRGTDTYSFETAGGAVKQAYVSQQALKKGDPAEQETAAYLTAENALYAYALANETALPEEITDLLEKELGEAEELTTTEAKIRIQKYLNSHVSYEETAGAPESGADLITDFLTETKEGHCVHYASAATAMLRYYGIPARYVEGYVLTKEEAAEAGENGTVTLTEQNAHAWTEYYLEGVGWLPFDPAPKYRGEILYAQTDDVTADEDAAGGGSAAADAKEDKDDEESKDTEDQIENPINNRSRIFVYGALFLLIAGLLALLILLGLLIARRMKFRKFRRSLRIVPAREGLLNAASYGAAVLAAAVPAFDRTRPEAAGAEIGAALGAETAAGWTRVLDLNRKARYSEHDITEEEREEAVAFAEKAAAARRDMSHIGVRLKDRWIRCIY